MKTIPARIHLLIAKDTPIVVVIRRKPSKVFHVIRWNTKTDVLESGSWFRGKLYTDVSDLSPDGKWMVYLAMGSNGDTWNGICNPPRLKTLVDWVNLGTYGGGGCWESSEKLLHWGYAVKDGIVKKVPLKIGQIHRNMGLDLGVMYLRMARDGWMLNGQDGAPLLDRANHGRFKANTGDVWSRRPTKKHPELRMLYWGYRHGYQFEFNLDEYPELLGPEVDWAGWDSLGSLVFSRKGVIIRYALKDLKEGKPTFEADLEALSPPPGFNQKKKGPSRAPSLFKKLWSFN